MLAQSLATVYLFLCLSSQASLGVFVLFCIVYVFMPCLGISGLFSESDLFHALVAVLSVSVRLSVCLSLFLIVLLSAAFVHS